MPTTSSRKNSSTTGATTLPGANASPQPTSPVSVSTRMSVVALSWPNPRASPRPSPSGRRCDIGMTSMSVISMSATLRTGTI
nr:hypothetical protein [Haloferax sp. ATB1]